MAALRTGFVPTDELVFLPLGGSGEIGMNLNLYGCDGKWLMVDLGITFGDDSTPGIDVMMADPGFIAAQRANLAAIVLTHAHEDHLGAVPYLWERLRCPVYATPFAAALLRRKLNEFGQSGVKLIEIPLGGRFQIGPFDLEYITLTHSIPEPNALAVRTRFGTVLHTGDWKIDPEPLIGEPTDIERLKALGDTGALAIVCDSTNALREGQSGSEADVRRALIAEIGEARGRVAVACFASNVARLRSIIAAAEAHGRHVALVGRSLKRIAECARETGYFPKSDALVSEQEIGYMPPERSLIVVTGCQGEPRAALMRIATDTHPNVTLGRRDTVIFSSRIIPGNEREIAHLQTLLIRKGIAIVTEKDDREGEAPIHVSGHPARAELRAMYSWIRPWISVPVHGEARHMLAHQELAREMNVPQAMRIENGEALRLAPGPAVVVARVPVGRLGVDGNRLVPMDGEVLRARNKLLHNGAVVATVVVDDDGDLATDPQISFTGIAEDDSERELREAVREAVAESVGDMPRGRASGSVGETVRREIRRVLRDATGRKPVIDVHVVRLPSAARRVARRALR